jgi:thiamine kinase-like enzyme
MHEEVSVPELTEVIARLAALLGPRVGGVRPLAGGITNRNFRVTLGEGDYVVRLPGKDTDLLGIDREAECLANERAAELGLAPKVAAKLESPPCLVTCFVEGHEMKPEELREPGAIGQIAAALREFHDSGLTLPTEFQVVDIARDYAGVARERGGETPQPFEDSLASAREVVEAVRDDPEHAPVPCHNDLLPANFLSGDERIVIVDWEYAGMGDRFFDLGNLAVNNEFGDEDEDRLLEAYFGEAATPRRQAALKLFRFMSDFREAMWGVVQSSVSDLDFDFDAYASKHFARLSETSSDERFSTWLEEVRGGAA